MALRVKGEVFKKVKEMIETPSNIEELKVELDTDKASKFINDLSDKKEVFIAFAWLVGDLSYKLSNKNLNVVAANLFYDLSEGKPVKLDSLEKLYIIRQFLRGDEWTVLDNFFDVFHNPTVTKIIRPGSSEYRICIDGKIIDTPECGVNSLKYLVDDRYSFLAEYVLSRV